jgi:hypothetical protein
MIFSSVTMSDAASYDPHGVVMMRHRRRDYGYVTVDLCVMGVELLLGACVR